ncbi:TetR family transcriptional regulator C-terminal domain-containing protein [Halomonas sp. PAMB 3264]|uniref:TetR family transcriptional regulator C-terminal domain-containing protein n=1 Tax=Halomonas sp. PAMB 3264 TaxID=3075222 RepID=UPI0028A0C630|nr:TetR family transcriptional regulator C-terminal domain-containing protein [Halomonas sp. PAMB 3264]WNL41636.1 TetR family transcriptional regulator C-terminal domain-containing protein [Halomonas sp. PAMB 3264]
MGKGISHYGAPGSQFHEYGAKVAKIDQRTQRSKQSRQETMNKIIDAAIIEFSQYGFQGVSTQAIAARANLKKSQLHYYIEDKEALYSKVLGKVLDSWRTIFSFDAHPDMSARDSISTFVRLKFRFALENPELSRIFTMEILSGGERLEKYWPYSIANTHSKVLHIQRWVSNGEMRTLDGRLLIMHIWALTQYYSDYTMQAELLMDSPLSDSDTCSKIEQELVTFVLMGCGIPT